MVLNVSHSPRYFFFFLKTCFCLLYLVLKQPNTRVGKAGSVSLYLPECGSLSLSTKLTFVLDNYLLWGLSYVYRLFSSIFGLYPRCVIYTLT